MECGYELENQEIAVRFSALEIWSSLLLGVKTTVGSHPSQVSLSPEVNRYGYETYDIPPSGDKIRISRAVPPDGQGMWCIWGG
jgi:hypothetical protein